MKAPGGRKVALRRFAASNAMHALALLVALLLPLHGVANAFSSIQTPAHYHHDVLAFVAAPPVHIPLHGTDVLLQLHEHRRMDAGGHEALVGHHVHSLDDASVAYVDDDSSNGDQGAAGKHVATSGEAPLPAWVMPLLATRSGQALPEVCCDFDSHRAKPPLRPPSTARVFPS